LKQFKKQYFVSKTKTELEKRYKTVEYDGWTDLDQDRDRWQALVNMVMSFWVP